MGTASKVLVLLGGSTWSAGSGFFVSLRAVRRTLGMHTDSRRGGGVQASRAIEKLGDKQTRTQHQYQAYDGQVIGTRDIRKLP